MGVGSHFDTLFSGLRTYTLGGRHRSLQEVSDAVGYKDVAFFRSLFQRHTGVSPSAYRQQFGL
jgi:YesN/AraC family two-component response regulator